MYNIEILTKKKYLEFIERKDITIIKEFATCYFLLFVRFIVVYTLKNHPSKQDLLLYLNKRIGQKNYKLVKSKSNSLYLTLFFGTKTNNTKVIFRIANHKNDKNYNYHHEILIGDLVDITNLSEISFNKITKAIENPLTYNSFAQKPCWMMEK